jgi:hypothetical protein
MSTPRQNGLESEVYAVGKEAAAIGSDDFISRAHALAQRLQGQWIPIFTAGGIRSDTEDLASDMAAQTERSNCLDVDDPYGPVGTAQQEAFVGGDVSAGLSAAADDIATTVQEEGTAVAKAATSGFSTLAWVALGLAALFVFVKANK